MAAVVQNKLAGVKGKTVRFYDWFSAHPFFNWRWSILDVAVIAVLVIH
jgi:hypothetical protein